MLCPHRPVTNRGSWPSVQPEGPKNGGGAWMMMRKKAGAFWPDGLAPGLLLGPAFRLGAPRPGFSSWCTIYHPARRVGVGGPCRGGRSGQMVEGKQMRPQSSALLRQEVRILRARWSADSRV